MSLHALARIPFASTEETVRHHEFSRDRHGWMVRCVKEWVPVGDDGKCSGCGSDVSGSVPEDAA